MINVTFSTEHWIVPRIIIGVLVVLLLAIIITEGRARVKAGQPFFGKPKGFFIPNADYFKLFGTLILFIAYIYLMDIIGFTVTSIIFVFLFNVLYTGVKPKSLLVSAIIAVVSSLFISILFGVVFSITLPKGICTMVFRDIGVTLY